MANFQLVDGIACGQSGDTVEVLLGDGRLRFEHHGLFETVERRSFHTGQVASWVHEVGLHEVAGVTMHGARMSTVRELGLRILQPGSKGMLQPALVVSVKRGLRVTPIVLQARRQDLEELQAAIEAATQAAAAAA